jgi:hypothetical protein
MRLRIGGSSDPWILHKIESILYAVDVKHSQVLLFYRVSGMGAKNMKSKAQALG